MKVMEAIGKGFSMTGKNFGLLVILFVFNVAWNLTLLPFLGKAQIPTETLKVSPQMVFLGFVFILLNLFIQGGLFGVLKDAIVSQRKAVLANFAKCGGKFYLRFLGLGCVILLGIALSVLIIGFIFSISLVVKNIIVNIVVVTISVILAAVALYYLFLFFFSPYILIMDDLSIFKALASSLRFVKNNLLKMAGLTTLLVLIGLGIGFIAGISTGILSFALKGTAFQVITGIITSAVNAYVTVIISAALMIYYHSVSGKKETGEISASA